MNKRILKIFNEAGFHQPEMERLGIEDKFEKFAELIVEECVAVLNRRFMGDMNREDIEVRRCIDDVKKHFGVEE